MARSKKALASRAAPDVATAASAPTVTSLGTSSGSTAGATSVTITGTNFIGASEVTFGGVPAASFTVNSVTSITAVSPAGSVGTIDVTVTTPNGTSATGAADKFSYGTCTQSAALLARLDGSQNSSAVDTAVCGMVTDGTWLLFDVLYVFATNSSGNVLPWRVAITS